MTPTRPSAPEGPHHSSLDLGNRSFAKPSTYEYSHAEPTSTLLSKDMDITLESTSSSKDSTEDVLQPVESSVSGPDNNLDYCDDREDDDLEIVRVCTPRVVRYNKGGITHTFRYTPRIAPDEDWNGATVQFQLEGMNPSWRKSSWLDTSDVIILARMNTLHQTSSRVSEAARVMRWIDMTKSAQTRCKGTIQITDDDKSQISWGSVLQKGVYLPESNKEDLGEEHIGLVYFHPSSSQRHKALLTPTQIEQLSSQHPEENNGFWRKVADGVREGMSSYVSDTEADSTTEKEINLNRKKA